MKKWILISILTSTICSCEDSSVTEAKVDIIKPTGIFSSSGSMSATVLNHTEVRGMLIRAAWKDIEPTEGSFNFTSIDNQINSVKTKGKSYSLAILAGGVGSPDWLIEQKGVPYFDYLFRGEPYKLPLIWNSTVLGALNNLAKKLADRYNDDPSLLLVYIPQMSANGVEGHLNGFNETDFKNAGYSESKWVDASIENARNFAYAFSSKALAFEVHDLFSSTTPASNILNSLWNDATLNHRVGAAMWWISGNYTYQPNLLSALETYPGDIYCQVIGRSDQTDRFPNGEYGQVFVQAKKLRVRYIEPWEYEFAIETWSSELQEFNTYADGLKKY